MLSQQELQHVAPHLVLGIMFLGVKQLKEARRSRMKLFSVSSIKTCSTTLSLSCSIVTLSLCRTFFTPLTASYYTCVFHHKPTSLVSVSKKCSPASSSVAAWQPLRSSPLRAFRCVTLWKNDGVSGDPATERYCKQTRCVRGNETCEGNMEGS